MNLNALKLPELTFAAPCQQKIPCAAEPDTVVLDARGQIWSQHYLTSPAPMLRFPGLADFNLVDGGTAAQAVPAPDVDERTIQLLWLNHVVPLLLSRGGDLVLHGGAVRIAKGAVGFLGASGAGKSTLTAYLARNGFPFLSDDMLWVCQRGDRIRVQPSEPMFRLWRDSEDALVSAPRDIRLADVSYTTKAQFSSGTEFPYCDEPLPLSALLKIVDRGAEVPVVTRMRPSAGVVVLVENSFLLDRHIPSQKQAHFERAASLAKQVPIFEIDYPRSYSFLHEVRNAVLVALG